jgi:hypothetical protein
MLNEESEEVEDERQNYSKHVEITPPPRGSLCAPGPEDRSLLREQALVDGLLVRKYKVLLYMQRERRRKRGRWSGTPLPWGSLWPSRRADRAPHQRLYPKTVERSVLEKKAQQKKNSFFSEQTRRIVLKAKEIPASVSETNYRFAAK